MHPEHRRHKNPFCQPLRKNSLLALGKHEKRQGTLSDVSRFWWLSCAGEEGTESAESAPVRAQLEAIWKAESVKELCDMMIGNAGVRLAYYFGHLTANALRKKHTIEFRQADGDLSEGSAFPMAWARVAVNLVAVSYLYMPKTSYHLWFF